MCSYSAAEWGVRKKESTPGGVLLSCLVKVYEVKARRKPLYLVYPLKFFNSKEVISMVSDSRLRS